MRTRIDLQCIREPILNLCACVLERLSLLVDVLGSQYANGNSNACQKIGTIGGSIPHERVLLAARLR